MRIATASFVHTVVRGSVVLALLLSFGRVGLCQQGSDEDQPPAENSGLVLPDAVDYRSLPLPPGIVTEEPYVRWTKHRGQISESIARIVARFPDGTVRETTGLSVRCDGLILAPVWVREAMKDKAIVTVAPAEAENETLASPLTVVSRFYHNIPRVEYTILKVNGHHIPCAPLLESKNISPGVKVRLYRATPDTAGKCNSEWIRATVGGPVDNPEVNRFDRHALLPEAGQPVLTAEKAPAGTIVVDEVSGGVLGIVLESGKGGAVFTSFLYFYDFTGEVGLMTSRQAIKDRDGNPDGMTLEQINSLTTGKSRNGFQWIPGGPVRLAGFTLDHYRRNFRTDTVCLPGFFIGTYPVTRRQYSDWFDLLPSGSRPLSVERPDNRELYPNSPQGLARSDSALLYASTHDARSPTEYEWRRATIRRDYVWAYRRLELWDRTMKQLISFFNTSLESAGAQADETQQNGLIVKNLHNPFSNEIPWHNVDVNLRAGEDVSIFGVTNVMMNNDEYLLATPALPGIAPKMFSARIDPLMSHLTISFIYSSVRRVGAKQEVVSRSMTHEGGSYYQFLQKSSSGTVADITYHIGLIVLRMPQKGTTDIARSNLVDLPQSQGVLVNTYSIQPFWEPKISPGFRLAR